MTFFVRNANIPLNDPSCYLPIAYKVRKAGAYVDQRSNCRALAGAAHPSRQRIRRAFGSASRNLSGDASDIDLVVEFERPIGLRFMELGDYLESLLGYEVDLLTPAGLQAIRSKAIRQEISESIVYV